MATNLINADVFKRTILSSISVSETELEQILSCFKQIKINKRDILIKENTFVNQYYFLEKGLLRLVYHTKDKEETSWVILDGSFFTEIISLKSKQPTTMRIEALEPSIVLCIDESNLNELCAKLTLFEKFLRLTWEENLYHVIQMKLLQQFSNARERYGMLIKDKNLMQRIPQKYLASILGITPYSLSRLRRQQKP